MNPIIQQMSQGCNILNTISQLKSLTDGNPQAAYQMLMQSNPKFKEFYEKNKGKSVDQIAGEYGIDLAKLNNIMKGI